MNAQLILMCGHEGQYMCSKCARCGNCCQCAGPLPHLAGTLSRLSQERLRELRRANQDAGAGIDRSTSVPYAPVIGTSK